MTMRNRPGPRNPASTAISKMPAASGRLPPLWPLSLSPRACLGYGVVTEEARGFGRTGNGLFSDPDKMLTSVTKPFLPWKPYLHVFSLEGSVFVILNSQWWGGGERGGWGVRMLFVSGSYHLRIELQGALTL